VKSTRPLPAVARARGRKPILAGDPKDRLYEAALECFARDGVRSTTMESIAARAGVTRTAIYHYFPSKREVILEVITRQATQIITRIRRQVARRDGLDAVIHAAYLGTKASIENPHVQAITRGDAGPHAAQLLRHQRFTTIERDFWTPLLTRAQDTGELRTDRPLDEIIDWIVFHQFTHAAHAPELGLTDSEIRTRTRTYLAAALAGQAPATPIDR
jgi:AcrR family transcriptional regulator